MSNQDSQTWLRSPMSSQGSQIWLKSRMSSQGSQTWLRSPMSSHGSKTWIRSPMSSQGIAPITEKGWFMWRFMLIVVSHFVISCLSFSNWWILTTSLVSSNSFYKSNVLNNCHSSLIIPTKYKISTSELFIVFVKDANISQIIQYYQIPMFHKTMIISLLRRCIISW
jgi:hypothetical protein